MSEDPATEPFPVDRAICIDALLVSACTLAVSAAVIGLGCGRAGEFGYALDDAWIHLAIARNLLTHGVWAPTGAEFASASSSPAWTGILTAVVALTGPVRAVPMIVDALLTFPAALAVTSAIGHRVNRPQRLIAATLIALCAPIPVIIASGMEHVLQIALFIPFAWAVACSADPRARRAMMLLAPFLMVVRYEAMFLLCGSAVVLALRKDPRAIAAPAVAAVLPIAFGLFSISQGGFLLPNPVIVKGSVHRIDSLGAVVHVLNGRGIQPIVDHPAVAVLIAATLILTLRRIRIEDRLNRPDVVFGALFIWNAFAQARWAAFGAYWRYESWLVAHGLLAVAILAAPDLKRIRENPLTAAAALLALGAIPRAFVAIASIPDAIVGIHLQQRQIAAFIAAESNGEPIVLNDIGAPSYFADPPIVDLGGLATNDVVRAYRAGEWDAATIGRISHGARFAVIYPQWFEKTGLPPEFRPVGSWSFAVQGSAAHDRVVFYAIEPGIDEELRAAVQSFPLPPGVSPGP